MSVDRQEVVKLYLKGVPVKNIAKKFNVSRERIYQILRAEPLFSIWKKVHYCMKHNKEIDILVQAKDKEKARQLLGFKKQESVLLLVARLVKAGCLDSKVLEWFRRHKVNIAEEIRRHIRLGMRNKDIAKKLGVSEKYVALVKYKLMKKQYDR